MKSLALLLGVSLLGWAAIGCGQGSVEVPGSAQTIDAGRAEPSVPPPLLEQRSAIGDAFEPEPAVAPMSAELTREFGSLPDLALAADRIVVASVKSRVDAPFRNLPFSQATVTVEQVSKGDLTNGAEIVVVETGGFVTVAGKSPGSNPGAVEMGIEGVPVMKPGQRLLLFLQGPTQSAVGAFPVGSFGLVGAFQGKVRIGTDGVLIPPAAALTGPAPAFAVARALNGRSLASVLAEIRNK